jgi:carbon-monoxide dehydrogenase medium subunit
MAVHYGKRTVKVAEPSTLHEAWRLKQEGGAGAVYVAGGTLLRTQWENGAASAPSLIIGLDGVMEYRSIAFDHQKEELVIGALTSLEEIRRSHVVAAHVPILIQAVSAIAAPSIRRLATLGGNIASLSGDAVTALLVLDAELTLYRGGPGLERVTLKDWLEGGEYVRGNGALVLEVGIPARFANGNQAGASMVNGMGSAAQGEFRSFGFFEKLGRREAFTPSIVTVAAMGRLDGNSRFAQVKLTAGGGAALPHRLYEAERFLNGRHVGPSSLAELHTLIMEGCASVGDLFASTDYRKEVAANLLTARLWELLKE